MYLRRRQWLEETKKVTKSGIMINNKQMPGGTASPMDSPAGNDWYSAANTPTPSYMAQSSDSADMNAGNAAYVDEDYDNEPPILEELGINFEKIMRKTKAVLNPTTNVNVPGELLDDGDMAGPLVFCLILGAEMLLTGKVNFGYIYGFSICSTLCCYAVLDLMVTGDQQVQFWLTASVLGYCLIPVCVLAGLDIILPLRNVFGLILAAGTTVWSTYSATKLFDAKLGLTDAKQFHLVSYPIGLIYSCFVLITIL